jgi:hypothetical protein
MKENVGVRFADTDLLGNHDLVEIRRQLLALQNSPGCCRMIKIGNQGQRKTTAEFSQNGTSVRRTGHRLRQATHMGSYQSFGQRPVTVTDSQYRQSSSKSLNRRNLDVAKFDLERDTVSDDRSFDVAVSMEVAEHLPESVADRYIDLLTRLGRTIVFTAAPPGQGGLDHVNEQPPSYWIEKFSQRCFRHDDDLSRRWRDEWKDSGTVSGWYSDNLMVFAREDAA